MWVVKIGGSLYDAPQLKMWLNKIAASGVPVIIVPGGGPFADQVRVAQQRWGVDDGTAHQMALCAMNQFGLLMTGIEPQLSRASKIPELIKQVESGRSVVWLPVEEDPDVEQSWRVTSDSLALWLAKQVDAEGVLLVKSATLTTSSSELLDAAFEEYRQGWGGEVKLVQRDAIHEWPSLII
ncbi:MAG: hypothetical protein OQL17_09370 [Sedimenticola sp.]|nr:hypothetical protein [Sedimenticola sp.]